MGVNAVGEQPGSEILHQLSKTRVLMVICKSVISPLGRHLMALENAEVHFNQLHQINTMKSFRGAWIVEIGTSLSGFNITR
ncbi:hypothetical protein FKM82_000337 [Ascaphus truei]